ncbi:MULTISPECIES: TAXI family TRAP transporter solute-binding subunit [unclassified Psychrobacillus]|uniref:TAXI family TRAP transporter solute-binding subunit n=1 Tax=unclassified Psychrobacillus TaxID=2636677 RepID=UPI00146AE11F|nr:MULTISPECIES: TAXI family TRAP transporter solute-binding subunit [unclassified Psychrobacillus]MCM3357493.1 TAXI family TRAP transporter solute-binding subunit [Psychrobacillus sp. MER TA 171]NME04668.1 TAXI family TRAP transporter solute-binding subunit [Psychrobacillus sp. BL-248-WT-3]
MKKKSFSIILFITVLALFMAGCSGGKPNIAIGPPASETNSVSKLILDAYGITDDDYKAYQEGFGDAADGVQDGNIDISIGILGLPAASIESLQNSAGDVVMMSLSDDAISYIEENSGYRRHTIPKDTYDFLDSDVETVTAYAILMGSTDTIDEELGYELTKIMIENANENTHAQAKQMILENALNGAEGLPIHPGAKRYYEEQGLTVDNPVAELTADKSNRKNDFILGTGSQGGTYYPLGGEMASIWNKHIEGFNLTNTETGASVENLSSIRDGNMDLGMSVHVPALQAVNGEAAFEGHEVPNAAFIGHIYPEVIQIVTRESSDIKSLDDVK